MEFGVDEEIDVAMVNIPFFLFVLVDRAEPLFMPIVATIANWRHDFSDTTESGLFNQSVGFQHRPMGLNFI